MNPLPIPFDPHSVPQWIWCTVLVPLAGAGYWLLTFGQRSSRDSVNDLRAENRRLRDDLQNETRRLRDDVDRRDRRIEDLERRQVIVEQERDLAERRAAFSRGSHDGAQGNP